jgi:hypothetical protein
MGYLLQVRQAKVRWHSPDKMPHEARKRKPENCSDGNNRAAAAKKRWRYAEREEAAQKREGRGDLRYHRVAV